RNRFLRATFAIKEQRLQTPNTHRICKVRRIDPLTSTRYQSFADWQPQYNLSMANYMRYVIALIVIVGVVHGQTLLEDTDRNVLGLNFPYGRGLDSELQLAKLMLVAPRFCHPKRNSELINSLLGLPKNMHNAGKKK
ncbi:pigment-dispersing hormone peptides-like, partial [Pseudomyrmex gracilis]|uniref:pigment-dispersing hormone peptides-like n=1 Tax=Pseudomyrmex gracilis TaxID=219809 RepID=UPI0009948F00